MAKLNIETKTVTTKKFNLELTETEIAVLRRIFLNIGGMPEGYRGVTDDIDDALVDSGIPAIDRKFVQAQSGIYFISTR
jgi:hypothetical protein